MGVLPAESRRKLFQSLTAGIGVAALPASVLTVIILFVPGILPWAKATLGWDKEQALAAAAVLTTLVSVAAVFLVRWALARRRPEIEQICRAYNGAAPGLSATLPGGRIIRVVSTPPALEVAGLAETPQARELRLASVYGLDAKAFAAALPAARESLTENSSHLILSDPPWRVASTANVWVDPLAATERLHGHACDFAMIKVLTSPRFMPDQARRWDRVARVSGGSVLVCVERRELILHLRHPDHPYGQHLHLVGGNYEPDQDHSLLQTATREGMQETGLHFVPNKAPCLLMQEADTNWHMAVFLGVGVDRAQADAMEAGLANDSWKYARDEGIPCVVKLEDLEAVMRRPMVPTCYMALCAWLLAGAPVDGRRGAVFAGENAPRRLALQLMARQPNYTSPG